jgi:hypothetical protein
MGQIDRLVARERMFPYRRRIESPASAQTSTIIGPPDDDPLVAARGVVNGVIFGIVLWAVILWAIL